MFKNFRNSIIIIFLFNHCASYWNARKNDLNDILSLHLHTKSYGVKTRISILDFGFYYKPEEGNSLGFQSGLTGNLNKESLSIGWIGYDSFSGLKVDPDYKEELKQTIREKSPQEIPEEKKKYYLKNFEKEKRNIELQKRNKLYEIYFPFGTTRKPRETTSTFKEKNFYIPALTELDFQFGLYFGLGIKINPGEFIDFVLGFFNFDLYNDDK